MTTVTVYLLSADAVSAQADFFTSRLSENQLAEVNKYKSEREKTLRIAGKYLLNAYTPPLPLSYGKYGKPHMGGAFFNLSHSGDYAALAVANAETGVDVEKIKPIDFRFANKILSAAERANISSPKDFLSAWTAKESLLKCVGSGLISRLNEVPSNSEGEKTYLGEKYFSRSKIFDGHIICVTLKSAEPFKIKLILADADLI